MDLKLTKKSVVITGGASNIGRAIALKLAEEGAYITVGDIDIHTADQVVRLAVDKGAAGAQTVHTDVTVTTSVENLFAQAKAIYGKVDIFINSVGWDKPMPFIETDPELWQKIVQLNFFSLLNGCKTALEYMVPNLGGAIIAISSEASRQGEPNEAIYSSMKAATNSLMKTLARENGRYHIRCNAVCPGLTFPEEGTMSSSSMWLENAHMVADGKLEQSARKLPLRKLGRAEDIANTVVFLASDKCAGHITGQAVSVSGGYSMMG